MNCGAHSRFAWKGVTPLVDTKHIGKKYGPLKYIVGAEKIKEFALAVGEENPLYLDLESDAHIAPPMFNVVYGRDIAAAMLLDTSLALNLMMLVHGEQEFEFGVPVRSGDVVTTTGFIKDIRQKGKNEFITLESESKNQNGEVTVIGRWTFVIRGL